MNSKMTSSKPYLVRAFYEWILDNKMTPYLVLDVSVLGTKVPMQYVEDGRIVLNISPYATEHLLLENSKVEFRASFGGVIQTILAPMKAVQAIYAKETGKGMIFSEEEDGDDLPPQDTTSGGEGAASSGAPAKGKGHLRVVK